MALLSRFLLKIYIGRVVYFDLLGCQQWKSKKSYIKMSGTSSSICWYHFDGTVCSIAQNFNHWKGNVFYEDPLSGLKRLDCGSRIWHGTDMRIDAHMHGNLPLWFIVKIFANYLQLERHDFLTLYLKSNQFAIPNIDTSKNAQKWKKRRVCDFAFQSLCCSS